jgi:hypothetical protein
MGYFSTSRSYHKSVINLIFSPFLSPWSHYVHAQGKFLRVLSLILHHRSLSLFVRFPGTMAFPGEPTAHFSMSLYPLLTQPRPGRPPSPSRLSVRARHRLGGQLPLQPHCSRSSASPMVGPPWSSRSLLQHASNVLSPSPACVQLCPTMAAAPSHLPGGRTHPCPSHSSPFGPAAASTQPLPGRTVLVQPLSADGWVIPLMLDEMTIRSFVLCAAPSATPSTPGEILFSPCRFSTRCRLSRC